MNLKRVSAWLLFLMMAISMPAKADRPTTIEVRAAAGVYGGTVSLQATLTTSGPRAVPNRTVSFALNGADAGSAVTDARGIATLNTSLTGIKAGAYSSGVRAVFAGENNLDASRGFADLTVDRAPASVTTNPAGKIYGSPDPPLTGVLSGFLPSDNVTAEYFRAEGETVAGGPYIIALTLRPADALSNYSFGVTMGSFTISPAMLTVTANNAEKAQGQQNPTFTATYSGFVNGDTESSLNGTLSFDTNATTSSPAGTYTIMPKGVASSNYAIKFVTGVLTVGNAERPAYLTDGNVYTPPAYLTFQPPAMGSAYTDTPPFYTSIRRISDSMHTPDAAAGTPSVVTISTEYSTMSPFNQDASRLLLVHLSYFALYDGSGVFLRNLPFEINASSQPRWSRSDPDVLYYVRGNQLKQFNAQTSAMSVVHTFNEYSGISGKGKSDISSDGDHFVLVGDGRYVFVYQISTDAKGNVFDAGNTFFNSVAITPNNNVLVAWNGSGSNRYQGIELFDGNMNFLRQVARADGHSDVTRDTNGADVLIWANANDPNPVCNNGVVKVRLADASQTCLATFDWSLAIHISSTDNSGWVFVETYAPGDPMPPTGWYRYTNELLQIKLDGSEVRRFVHHRSRPFNGYTWQPKLAISRDGSKLAYASNFGLQQILGYPAEYSDVYTIDMSAISADSVGTAEAAAR